MWNLVIKKMGSQLMDARLQKYMRGSILDGRDGEKIVPTYNTVSERCNSKNNAGSSCNRA